jgi:type III restriction enzyme
MTTVVAHLNLAIKLAAAFLAMEDRRVAEIASGVIRGLENKPHDVPSIAYLQTPEIQEMVRERVESEYHSGQMELDGITAKPDIEAIVAKTTELVVEQSISIPMILVVPKGISAGFARFTMDLGTLRYPPPSDELWIQHLRTNQLEVLGLHGGGVEESRLEDYVVSGLVDFDDISYDNHAYLLYNLAGQTVEHFCSYLSEEEAREVLRLHQREIARFIHAQMQEHYWENVTEYDVEVRQGFCELKECAYTTSPELQFDFHQSPSDKSNMAQYLFNGFSRCLYPAQKFHSDTERKLAVVLDRESLKWFRPAKGQFQIYYRSGGDHLEYQPDFVAEDEKAIYMLEAKAQNEMNDAEVLAKAEAAVKWCRHASDYARTHEGKLWIYALIPHNAIAENMTLEELAAQFAMK